MINQYNVIQKTSFLFLKNVLISSSININEHLLEKCFCEVKLIISSNIAMINPYDVIQKIPIFYKKKSTNILFN